MEVMRAGGAALSAALVLVGDRLGLYKELALRAVTSVELAQRTGTNERGRVMYGASSQICVPVSLARNGPALGAQAGEERLREVVVSGGFARFRRATETPFNLVLEARP